MDGLIQWVKNLIFIILFTSLLEMFLPENSMRKYVRVVMGFFIVTILISPLMTVFYQDFSVIQDIIPERIVDSNWNDIKKKGQEIEESNQNILRGYYENKVAKRIKEVVDLDYEEFEQEIKVTLDDDYRIKSLCVILIDQGINTVEIESVDIGGSNERNLHDQVNNMDIKQRSLREDMIREENLEYKLSQVFQIPEERIEVIIKKGG